MRSIGDTVFYRFDDDGREERAVGVMILGGKLALQLGGADLSGVNPLPVAARTANPLVTPVVTAAAAYASGNVVGGKMTFAGCVDGAGSGLLQSIRLAFRSVQTVGFKLWLFAADPAASTFTDKAAPSIASADVDKLIGVYALGGGGDSGLGVHTLYTLDGIGKAFSVASGAALYGVLTTTGAPTFAATGDLSVALGILKD